jgi:hypothetical protein
MQNCEDRAIMLLDTWAFGGRKWKPILPTLEDWNASIVEIYSGSEVFDRQSESKYALDK